MIDPHDPGTLDLVAACEEPLSGAERARRHRLKKKQETQAGQRAALDLKAPELTLLAVALGEYRERWSGEPDKADAATALLASLPAQAVAKVSTGAQPAVPRYARHTEKTYFPLADEIDAACLELHRAAAVRESSNRTTSFDELVTDLLTNRDRTLLQWARRNEELVAATPANQAYPEDPTLRNLLGKALNEKHELNGRYQILLSQALELYEMLDVTQAAPRMSSPAGFVRDYKRYSENWQITRSTEGEGFTKNCFKDVGRGVIRPVLDGLPDETRYLVLDVGLIEALKVLGEKVAQLESAPPVDARSRIAALERENALLESERNKAHGAIALWEQRLGNAGLSTDYRRQPGE